MHEPHGVGGEACHLPGLALGWQPYLRPQAHAGWSLPLPRNLPPHTLQTAAPKYWPPVKMTSEGLQVQD